MDRFSVQDPRPEAEKQAQLAVQKLVRKAFREAKALKQKQKQKARAAKALAAKEQQLVKIVQRTPVTLDVGTFAPRC